jgi:hypothetical protein
MAPGIRIELPRLWSRSHNKKPPLGWQSDGSPDAKPSATNSRKSDRQNLLSTTRSHRRAMKSQKAIVFLIPIGCSIIGALYSLAQTHSFWSFIILCAAMGLAVMTTAGWYTADDQQQ